MSAAACAPTTLQLAVAALERPGGRADPARRARSLGSSRRRAGNDLRPAATIGSELTTGEPPDPAAARHLHARVRDRIRPRVLDPSRARPARSRARRATAPRDDHHSRRAAGRSTTAWASQLAIGEEAIRSTRIRSRCANAQRVAVEAGRALALDPNKIYPQLLDRKQSFVYVATEGRPRAGGGAERQGLAGVDSYPEERRIYPQHSVASQVLGYAGDRQHGHRRARARSRRSSSRASPARRRSSATRSGARSTWYRRRPSSRAGTSSSRWTTRSRQGRVGARETLAKWHATDGTAIILDPRTGGVLAMAVAPGFDANKYPKVPSSHQRNRAVTDTYEPGSTFKVVTLRGGAHRARVTPNTTFMLASSIEVADRTIDEAEPRRPRRCPLRRCSPGRRTSARSRSPSCSAGSDSVHGSTDSASGRPQASTSRERARGSSCRWRSGRARRSGTSRSARASPSRRSRWHPAYAALANRGVWLQPHLVDHVRGRKPAKIHRRRVVSPHDRPRADGDAPGRRLFGRHRRRGGGAGLPGRGEDGNRGQARLRTAATRTRTTSPRSSGSFRPARPARSSSSRSTSRRVRSSAASSPPRHSATSPASRSSTWMSRRTTRRR